MSRENLISPDMNLALMHAQNNAMSHGAKNIEAAKKARELKQVEETAQDFEAVFIAEMMKPLFEGINTETPFGGGKGEEVFRGMMVQEYGKMMAGTGRIGLADSIVQAMIQMQETADAAQSGFANFSEAAEIGLTYEIEATPEEGLKDHE